MRLPPIYDLPQVYMEKMVSGEAAKNMGNGPRPLLLRRLGDRHGRRHGDGEEGWVMWNGLFRSFPVNLVFFVRRCAVGIVWRNGSRCRIQQNSDGRYRGEFRDGT